MAQVPFEACLAGARVLTLRPGMRHPLAERGGPHRPQSVDGAKLFIMD